MCRFVLWIVLAGISLAGLAGCGDKQGGVTKTDSGAARERVPAPPNQPR